MVQPVGSTDCIAFSTDKPCEPTKKSHISHVVADSRLELAIARELECDSRVVSYAKNDRLFLEIPYSIRPLLSSTMKSGR
jgi:type III restriction enzyme